MLRVFRNMRNQLLGENRFTHYIFYALGEIILVVIGILIALQVNNWNENRKIKQQAEIYRQRLVDDLNSDIKFIRVRIDYFDQVERYLEYALNEMGQPKANTTEEKWQFVLAVFQASQKWDFYSSNATYYEIQNSSTLSYLGDPQLLNDLSFYYNSATNQLHTLNDGTQAYRDYTRRVINWNIQNYIWSSCYEVGGTHYQKFVNCSPPSSEDLEIERTYNVIINNKAFTELINSRISIVHVRNMLYGTLIEQCEKIIAMLQESK